MRSLPRLAAVLILSLSLVTVSPARAADGTPPLTEAALTGNLGTNGWYTSTVTVGLTSEDLESGVQSITYTLDGAQTVQNYSSGANLLPNPSFESGSVDGWVVGGSAGFTQDSSTAKFDLTSVKITSTDTGYKDWQTQNGIVLTAGHTYTLSAWVKYSSVVGGGVKLLLDSASSDPLTGTRGSWTRTALTFTPLTTGAYFPKLGIDGPGIVNFDGAYLSEEPFPAGLSFVVSSSGFHNLSWFGTNNDGVSGVPQSLNFKIDAQGPGNWHNLQQIQAGNDHTMSFTVQVDDSLSGLNPPTGQFQYSLDGGSTWGYHTNLTSCNSTWVPDGWQGTSQSPSVAGVATTTMTTPAIDFCDSDFSGCNKKIRFDIKDMAGNESSRDQCLNSAWFKAQGGDVHSVGNISPSSQSEADYVVSSVGAVSGITSAANWIFPAYPLSWDLASTFTDWWNKYYVTAQALPGGKLPGSGSGYFRVAGSFTLDSGTLPTNIGTANVTAVVFINGNLSVNSNFTMPTGSAYVFVVSGDVLVNGGVTAIAGLYLSQGKFDDHSGGSVGSQLTVNGAAWSIGGVELDRDLGKNTNTSTPADRFILPAGIFTNPSLSALLSGSQRIVWREIQP